MRLKPKPEARNSINRRRTPKRTTSAKWAKIAGRLTTIVEGGPTTPIGDLRDAVLADSAESEADEWLCLYRVTQLLSMYGRHNEARAVIAAHRDQAKGQGQTTNDSVYSLLEASVSVGAGQTIQRYPEAIRTICSGAHRFYWARNVAIAYAGQANLHPVVLDHLKFSGCETRPMLPPSLFERGDCLTNLGIHFYFRGDLTRARGYLDAAARVLARDPAWDSRLKLVRSRVHTGLIAYHEGKLDRAETLFKDAIQDSRALRHERLSILYRQHLATLYARRGDFSAAEGVMSEVIQEIGRSRGTKRLRRLQELAAHVSSGHIAAEQGKKEAAARYCEQATKIARRARTDVTNPYVALLHGRILALDGNEESYTKALAFFENAWRAFQSIGDGWLLGLYRVTLNRGHVHLKYGNFDGALQDASQLLRFARDRKFSPARAAGLLLKSQLLLQENEDVILDVLYEEVLENLSSIHDPRVLFRIIANLYLYSWDGRDDLELTAYHMDQLNHMREVLDAELWDVLYDRYVARPILHRTLVGGFGTTPNGHLWGP